MGHTPSPSDRPDRPEQLITGVFVISGGLLLAITMYWTVTGWGDLQVAVAMAEGRSPTRVAMQELNREILAAFVGAVFFGSGVLRWRE